MKEIKQCTVNDSLYQEILELREKIMRRPLGMTNTPEDVEKDYLAAHFGLLDNGVLVATANVIPETATPTIARIRQVAVDLQYQGHGLGKEIMEHLHQFIGQHSYTGIVLHARRTAEPFYAKLGYMPEGEEFMIHNIPHVVMRRTV